MPQLRQDIVTGEWVVIAPERAKRPNDFKRFTPPSSDSPSPFLVGGKAWKTRVKEADTTSTFTIPNLYPAFVCDEKMCETRSYYPEKSFFRAKPAVGDHEIVVVKNPEMTLYDFTPKIWDDLFAALQLRTIAHTRRSDVEHILPFYNHGVESGASIMHPHAQIIAAPIVPNYIQRELEGSEAYYSNNGVNVFADLIEHELAEKVRIVAQNSDFLAVTAFAARFPFEVWIIPLSPGSHYQHITAKLRKNLAAIMHEVIGQLNRVLEGPSLNFWIHTAPTIYEDVRHYRWHIEIAPRVVGYGGFELGSDVVIDVMSPEVAANYLRKG